jgi:hypothetical protein
VIDDRGRVNDEARLLEKLRAIEALFAGATTPGERVAADNARQRIRARIDALRAEASCEFRFTVDRWSRSLLLTLAQRYDLKPYRYSGQRHTTVMLRAPERFMREVFEPEYRQMFEVLHEHLAAVTERVVAEALQGTAREPTVVDAEPPRALPAGTTDER